MGPYSLTAHLGSGRMTGASRVEERQGSSDTLHCTVESLTRLAYRGSKSGALIQSAVAGTVRPSSSAFVLYSVVLLSAVLLSGDPSWI